MGANLLKSPLPAIFYAGLLWLTVSALPRSEAYAGLFSEFNMPIMGFVYIIIYSIFAAVGLAVTLSGIYARGSGFILPVSIFALGVQCVVPAIPQLITGENTATLSMLDIVFRLAGGCVASILLVLLGSLVYKTAYKPQRRRKGDKPLPPEPTYRLNYVTIVIKVLLMPVAYTILNYVLWYFISWQSEVVRGFYGQTEKQNLMGEIIRILINDGVSVLAVFIVGFAYALFSFILLTQMRENRILFIISNVLFYLTGAAYYLIPSPTVPDAVRMAQLPQIAILLLVYGIFTSTLLHLSCKKIILEPVKRPRRRPRPKPEIDAEQESDEQPDIEQESDIEAPEQKEAKVPAESENESV